jgi:hypothetical protein
MARRRQSRSRKYGWLAVGVVVIVVLVIVLANVLSSSSGGDVNGRNPPLADPAVVQAVTTVPASVFDQVGVGAITTAPFSEAKDPPVLGTSSKPEFIYYGAEYCPYCAEMRWSIVTALARFGTWKNLKQISSAADDGDIPTFSFHKTTYTSKYLTFNSTEYNDRVDGEAFEPTPQAVLKIVEKYNFPPYTPTENESGIPFLDVGGRYYSSGVAIQLYNMVPLLENGGPGRLAIANAIRDPNSAVGKSISAATFIAQANYITAAICNENGMQPSTVCQSKGVTAARTALAKLKPIS